MTPCKSSTTAFTCSSHHFPSEIHDFQAEKPVENQSIISHRIPPKFRHLSFEHQHFPPFSIEYQWEIVIFKVNFTVSSSAALSPSLEAAIARYTCSSHHFPSEIHHFQAEKPVENQSKGVLKPPFPSEIHHFSVEHQSKIII